MGDLNLSDIADDLLIDCADAEKRGDVMTFADINAVRELEAAGLIRIYEHPELGFDEYLLTDAGWAEVRRREAGN